MSAVLRRLFAFTALAAVAVGLTGCVGISAVGTNQPESMGPINLSLSACAAGSPGCTGATNTGSIYDVIDTSNIDAQALLAFRLPNGSIPPDSFRTSGGTLTFARSPSYESELQALEPAPAGERWWGWISNVFNYSQRSGQSFTATISASLPRPADGGPYESPMQWRPVAGGRVVNADPRLSAGRAVDCGSDNRDLYSGFSEVNQVGSTVVCIDSPSPEAARGFLTAPLTDFGILGTTVRASAGTTATAAFVARRTGNPDSSTVFNLAATSGIPGGSVAIDRGTVPLNGDATQPVVATIDVPAGTPAGSYPVTLTATAAGKPTREGTATVTVPEQPPRLTNVSIKPRRFHAGPGAKLRFKLSRRATVTFVLKRKGARSGRRALSRTFRVGRNTFAFHRRIGKARLRPGAYLLRLLARSSDGQASAAVSRRFTLLAG